MKEFTFHFDSIKTGCRLSKRSAILYLHFTLILLKQAMPSFGITGISKFTFHFDSIKTENSILACSIKNKFTFHFDSIKTNILNRTP